MLVPLRTLPGWPTVDDPSLLTALLLYLGLPGATILLIWFAGVVSRLARRGRGETGPEIEHPLSIWGLETEEQYRELVTGETSRPAIER
ncbi:hypothetical protein [Auraticoccus monumenti]|uniref:Uncharacterized protein n=1 Tax=Auraticoccus monumenti TaxID=675864 RepID=A0A1G7EVD0_9ACTN|nr:hypothetical protein [Auraticoccus monumenti]SDE67552.1 hypothetical protein SAMN04489747_4054 [Auraticoccus monumenti]